MPDKSRGIVDHEMARREMDMRVAARKGMYQEPKGIEGRSRARRAELNETGAVKELIRTWRAHDDEFRVILDELLDEGRQDILDLACLEMAELHVEDADTFSTELMENAEYGTVDPDACARLVIVTAFVRSSKRPDPAEFGRSVAESGWFTHGDDVSFFPAWFPTRWISELSPCGARQLLRDLVGGKPPSVFRPDSPADSEHSIMLVGTGAASQTKEDTVGVPLSRAPARVWSAVEAYNLWRERVQQDNPAIIDVGTPAPPSEVSFRLRLEEVST